MRLDTLFFVLIAATLPAEEFVPAMPSEARLFLRVPEGAAPLKDVQLSSGEWSPGDFEADAEKRNRLTDIRFPLSWWQWKECIVHFTPAHDGTMDLDLNGPWGETAGHVLLQQEVLWDQLSVEGGELSNGGFEEGDAGKPATWDSPWRAYPGSDAWPLAGSEPLAGKRLAASWHGRPLVGTLTVKAGVPVTLKLHARAAPVPGFKVPAVLPADSPAHRACARLKRGMNLGNCWEAPPGSWGIQCDTKDIDRIAAEGFDHIRVPVGWHFRLEKGVINPAFLLELEPILKRALERKLTVILDWHNFEALCREPEKNRATFAAGWEVIARHFKDWPPQLYLELLNEPNGALDHETLTAIHAEAIAAIRKTNPQRILLVNPSRWAGILALDRLFLPDSDDRIIASVHSYEPFQFTHQQAEWVGFQDLKGILYPGPPPTPLILPDSLRGNNSVVSWVAAYNTKQGRDSPCNAATFEVLLDDAVAWSKHFGRPVHIGEFGAFQKADPASRSRYIRDFRDFRIAAEKRGLPWTMWEWKAGFGYWDHEKDKALLREALFGK